MKAITVKYSGPTDTRGSRWVVRAEGVPMMRVPIDNRKGADESAFDAAIYFAHKLDWLSGCRLVGGMLPDGKTRVYVMVEPA